MMAQLLAHLWGDYILQSDWMAQNKRHYSWPCWCHCLLYSLCFVPLLLASPKDPWWRNLGTLCFIFTTHFVIDRWGLARYLNWAKNWIGARDHWLMIEDDPEFTLSVHRYWTGYQVTPPFRFCRATGYPPGRPEWLAVWLLIIADNTLHLTCNYIALRWL